MRVCETKMMEISILTSFLAQLPWLNEKKVVITTKKDFRLICVVN